MPRKKRIEMTKKSLYVPSTLVDAIESKIVRGEGKSFTSVVNHALAAWVRGGGDAAMDGTVLLKPPGAVLAALKKAATLTGIDEAGVVNLILAKSLPEYLVALQAQAEKLEGSEA